LRTWEQTLGQWYPCCYFGSELAIRPLLQVWDYLKNNLQHHPMDVARFTCQEHHDWEILFTKLKGKGESGSLGPLDAPRV
jgi:hypothetical protein